MLNPNIPNAEFYRQELSKPLIDKVFFADKIEADLYVDFGCADGVLLNLLSRFGKGQYIGYDINEFMLENCPELPNTLFTQDWQLVREALHKAAANGQTTCVILSSIIHEIYHYSKHKEIGEFWTKIFGDGNNEPGFDIICIRDMMVSQTTSRPANPLMAAHIRQLHNPQQLMQWENTWGSLNENWSLVHFLLTYRYQENWTRELEENYLPLTMEDLLYLFPKDYMPIFIEHFVPPFLRRQIRLDFNIELADPTHIKLIYERQI